uniref:zinc-binding alcohol dehydrogenase family protein n=1 Tax=Thaumasiovibrio occultus TaxID=1891184 RepID=UPI000B363B77|nr:zinc-binding alcohol dehydrogenase family protein [Thaumasiovibrio occultus]
MKAIGYQQNLPIDNPLSLQDIELDAPTAKGHDILVKVRAVSANPVDYKVRTGMQVPEGEWRVLGFDAAGTVQAVGEDVTLFKPGDKVWYAGDLTRPGSNAEFQLVDERIVGFMPHTLSFAQAAAMPLTSITAWEMLFDRLDVDRNDATKSILIIGAAGGVGSIMVQLIKTLTQLTIVATASRPETQIWLEALGADHILNHHCPLSKEFDQYELPHVDYVVSLNHTEKHQTDIAQVVKPQGKVGLIDDPEIFNIMPFKSKSVSIHWEFMFTRSMFHTKDMRAQHQLLNEIASLIDSGELKTTVGEHLGTINAENLRRAHQRLEAHSTKGKIVLEGFE